MIFIESNSWSDDSLSEPEILNNEVFLFLALERTSSSESDATWVLFIDVHCFISSGVVLGMSM